MYSFHRCFALLCSLNWCLQSHIVRCGTHFARRLNFQVDVAYYVRSALHRIQRHPQTMQVSPLNRYRPKIIPYSNKFVMVDMFVVMLVLLRRRRGEGEFYWVLKRMTSVLQVVLNSCSISFLPSNASSANYTAGLQPKKFRPSLRFSSKSFLFSRFCHLMSDIASDLVLFLPSNALHSNYTTWLQPKKV